MGSPACKTMLYGFWPCATCKAASCEAAHSLYRSPPPWHPWLPGYPPPHFDCSQWPHAEVCFRSARQVRGHYVNLTSIMTEVICTTKSVRGCMSTLVATQGCFTDNCRPLHSTNQPRVVQAAEVALCNMMQGLQMSWTLSLLVLPA
jgi:hypothetical protein